MPKRYPGSLPLVLLLATVWAPAAAPGWNAPTCTEKVLGVLMDEGYLVRSANGTLGTVSFFQQWQDPDQADANIIQEGSLLFTPEGPESTQVRLMLTGSSQRLQANDSKRKYSAMVMVGVVQQDLGPEECSKVLDLLEKGLVTRSPG